MNISIRVRDERVLARYRAMEKALDRDVPEGIDKGLDTAYEAARRYAPVDTGHLRDSIRRGEHSLEVQADYAGYVEYGTVDTAPQPFFRPAVEEGLQEIRDTLREVLP